MTQTTNVPETAKDPAQTLGIVGLVLSFVVSLVGLVISIVAVVKSKRAGFTNVPGIVGIVVGALATAVTAGLLIITITAAVGEVDKLAEKCAELGPGTHQVGDKTYTCR